MQSRETDLLTKLRQLLTDLLITGYTFFRVKASQSGTNIDIEVLNPLNTFIDRNPESPYVKNSYRSVVRYWMTKSQILAKYGKELSKQDVSNLKEKWDFSENATYHRTYSDIVSHTSDYDTLPGYPDFENTHVRY
jgi:lantibiotic modifying enzyme